MPTFNKELVSDTDRAFESALGSAFEAVTRELESRSFKGALEAVMEFSRQCNKYVDEKAPWTTRKTDMEVTKLTLAYSLRAIHALGVMLSPFVPTAAAKILSAFGREAGKVSWTDAVSFDLVGGPLSQPPILFQKIGVAKQA